MNIFDNKFKLEGLSSHGNDNLRKLFARKNDFLVPFRKL